MVKVETVWAFRWKRTKLYTNTICTYLAPDKKTPPTFSEIKVHHENRHHTTPCFLAIPARASGD